MNHDDTPPADPRDAARRAFIRLGTTSLLAAHPSLELLAAMPAQSQSRPAPDVRGIRALVFDTFGTVVDWRASVIAEVEQLARSKKLNVDGAKFADAWRGGYAPAMNRVRTGQLPWTKLDDLHRMILDGLLPQFGMTSLSPDEVANLNRVWHRLRPWPDAPGGLTRLKKRFVIAPLSNGNIALMTNLAKFGGLPWDCILGAELVRHYKPDREVYQSAADFLGLRLNEVMMVAAHLPDLRAAKEVGLRTAFVPRPMEQGPQGKPDLQPDDSVELTASDFNALAAALGT
jgi:2-haloacid dehalogenase